MSLAEILHKETGRSFRSAGFYTFVGLGNCLYVLLAMHMWGGGLLPPKCNTRQALIIRCNRDIIYSINMKLSYGLSVNVGAADCRPYCKIVPYGQSVIALGLGK